MSEKPSDQNKLFQICSECSSYMITHPENDRFLKCPTCGFCKEVKYLPISPIVTPV